MCASTFFESCLHSLKGICQGCPPAAHSESLPRGELSVEKMPGYGGEYPGKGRKGKYPGQMSGEYLQIKEGWIVIRRAEYGDLQALLDIYNYEVEHGVATLDLNPKTLAEWEKWFFSHNVENHPLLVAEVDGQAAGNCGPSDGSRIGRGEAGCGYAFGCVCHHGRK